MSVCLVKFNLTAAWQTFLFSLCVALKMLVGPHGEDNRMKEVVCYLCLASILIPCLKTRLILAPKHI